MNASKLEKVGIQLNHVANSPDVTVGFLSGSLTYDHWAESNIQLNREMSCKEKRDGDDGSKGDEQNETVLFLVTPVPPLFLLPCFIF